MQAPVTLGVLGGLALSRRGERVALGGPKALQVLAVLVADRGRATPTDRLVDTLWAGRPPASCVATVQTHISRLRGALGPEIEIVRESDAYRLDAPDDVIDATRFERLLDEARSASDERAAALLTDALALWRGPAFGEHADLEHVRSEAMRLDELRLVAIDAWATARLAIGDAAAMVGELEALVHRHPLRERFWVLLMLALHRTGRQAEALRAAHELREMLGRETGLDVSQAVRDLEQRIITDDPSLLLPDHRRATGADPAAGSTPLDGPTPFIGRGPELDEVVAAMSASSLVSVIGPGGVGKTRLALRAVGTLDARDAGEVVVVELAPLRDPAGVGQVIAHALDIQQRHHRTLDTTIVEYLAGRRMVLVLDNCEHVTDALAPLVDRLRSGCPNLVILATSRQPLGLAAERVVVVPPLGLPQLSVDPSTEVLTGASVEQALSAPAVELFVSRANSALPGFELAAGNVDAVVRICRRLDGLPLAIELAAARLRAMGVDALADRLDRRVQSLGVQRGGDGRHRTIEGLVRWSYDLLDVAVRQVFAQLAVFAGGFDLDAAEAVCSVPEGAPIDVVEALTTLVDHSMVVVVDARVPRYRLLEPLREFALDRLGDDELASVEERHLTWFVDLARRGAVGLDSHDEARWSAQLDRDLDNLRAAHRRAVLAGDTGRALELVASLRELSFRSVQYEVLTWAEHSSALPGADDHPDIATVRAMVAYGHWVRGDVGTAIALAHGALAGSCAGGAGLEGAGIETDGPHGAALSSSGLPERVLGNSYFYLGDRGAALHWMDRMLESATAAGDGARRAHGLYMRSVAGTSVGDTVRGAIVAGEARAVAERVGSPTALAQAEYALGLALEGTDRTEALAHLERSAALAAGAGNRWVEAFALTEVHWLRARGGEHLAALRGFAEVVRTWFRGGDWANQWLSMRHVFGILIDLGAFHEAAVLQGALTAAGAAHALPFEPADAERLAGVVEELRALVGADQFAEAVSRGAAMSDTDLARFVIDHLDAITTG